MYNTLTLINVRSTYFSFITFSVSSHRDSKWLISLSISEASVISFWAICFALSMSHWSSCWWELNSSSNWLKTLNLQVKRLQIYLSSFSRKGNLCYMVFLITVGSFASFEQNNFLWQRLSSLFFQYKRFERQFERQKVLLMFSLHPNISLPKFD